MVFSKTYAFDKTVFFKTYAFDKIKSIYLLSFLFKFYIISFGSWTEPKLLIDIGTELFFLIQDSIKILNHPTNERNNVIHLYNESHYQTWQIFYILYPIFIFFIIYKKRCIEIFNTINYSQWTCISLLTQKIQLIIKRLLKTIFTLHLFQPLS